MSEEINNNSSDNISSGNNKSGKARAVIRELLVYGVIILVFVFLVPRYVFQLTIVDGESMTDTLQDNDRLFVEKVSYRFGDPDRFDIIVFYPFGRDDPDDYYVKRIIGLPGETVQIIDSVIYINNEPLSENYRKEPYMAYNGIANEPLLLGEDEYFVLGDNRNGSTDSRDPDTGPVKRENIDGRVVLRVYPFDEFGLMTDK
ncbi:MAG: signal peptidase I [Lachnospiraceae bacterium]|nr:signal peptidase I [Lachnospiraceae bacterium]